MSLTGFCLLFAALLLGVNEPAAAQPRVDPDCSDDRGVDRCSPEQQARVRELFGVRTIEEHAAAGDQVRRAFYVDGYGRDVIAIAFVRAAGREPMLWVHFPLEDGRRVDALSAPVPEQVWQDVLSRSSHFDRRLVPLRQPDSDEEIALCMHSWVYTIEAVDPPAAQRRQPTIRRQVEDACEDGLAEAYAGELQRAAVPLLPHCFRLDRSQHRNSATLLSACRLLEGDRVAAAEVFNRANGFLHVEGPDDAGTIRYLFDHDSVVDWDGQTNQGAWSAGSFWAARIGDGEGRSIFYFDRVRGENAERVIVSALLGRPRRDAGYESARVEQIWRREGSQFIAERITVGPFEPVPEDE